MSFEDVSPDAGESGIGAGPDDGDTGSEAIEQHEEAPEPPRQYVEIDDPDNRYVRVKVDGEDVEVPYSEAIRGYSREADYTRKAQAAAEARREAEFGLNLQRALQANPEMTLQILAQQHGINFGMSQQQAPEEEVDDDVYVDPLERQIVQERRAREALEMRLAERETDEYLRGTIGQLRAEFGLNDEDVQNVVQTALQNNLDIGQIPMVWKAMAFDQINARVRASQQRQRESQAEEARRTNAKAAANQTVQGRTIGSNGLTDRRQPTGNMSLRDAIEAAFEEHTGGR